MINLYLKEETALVKTATIYGINGPVIYLKGNTGFCMSESRSWWEKSLHWTKT